jgi:adenylate cyclase
LTGSGAWIVVAPGTPAERLVPISGRLLVGRECAGADPDRCLIVDDPSVSRDHVEVRVLPARQPELIDRSTNGTHVNGRRVERGTPIALRSGDRIEVGSTELQFRTTDAAEPIVDELHSTIRETGTTTLAIAVGDIVGYTGLTLKHDPSAVAAATDTLFTALGALVSSHGGTVGNYAGDAMFVAWDAGRNPDAAALSVRFALAADELVRGRAPDLLLRDAAGDPLRMGWGVTLGEAGIGRPSAGREELHGEAVILAFRLAGLASRGETSAVLVAADAAKAAPGAANYGKSEWLAAKGYDTTVEIFSATRS